MFHQRRIPLDPWLSCQRFSTLCSWPHSFSIFPRLISDPSSLLIPISIPKIHPLNSMRVLFFPRPFAATPRRLFAAGSHTPHWPILALPHCWVVGGKSLDCHGGAGCCRARGFLGGRLVSLCLRAVGAAPLRSRAVGAAVLMFCKNGEVVIPEWERIHLPAGGFLVVCCRRAPPSAAVETVTRSWSCRPPGALIW